MIPTLTTLPVDCIVPSPHNRMVDTTTDDFNELVLSVQEKGLLQPPKVRQLGSDYQLIFGERRWRAARKAGLTEITVLLADMSDAEAAEETALENIQREDLTFMEEAAVLSAIIENYSIEEAAAKLGKSVTWCYQRAKLLNLSPAWQKAMRQPVDITERWPRPAFAFWGLSHLEAVSRLGQDAQDKVMEEYKDSSSVPNMKDLEGAIGQTMRQLQKAAFDIEDAQLVPAAGSCFDCPKRKGTQPGLFATVEDINKDTCLDGPCFNHKLRVHTDVLLAAAKVRSKDTLELLEAKRFQHPKVEYKVGKFFNAGTMLHQRCKKTEAGAKSGVVMTGSYQGRLYYVKPLMPLNQVNTYWSGEKTKEEKRVTVGEKRKQLQRRRDLMVIEQFGEAFSKFDYEKARTYLPRLPSLATFAVTLGGLSADSACPKTAWATRFKALDNSDGGGYPDLWKMVKERLLDNLETKTKVPNWPLGIKDVAYLCDLFGLPFVDYTTEAVKKHQPPKTWAGLADDQYSGEVPRKEVTAAG
jgi:ParB/RepB/Spo0J family partition protein